MSNKPILAYDCACTGASIALRINGNTHTRAIGQTAQAAELVPTIDALLRDHGVRYVDLGAIVTTVGPGSFTGVRIGLATLHGFVLVANIPVKLLTTLEAMAWQVAASEHAPEPFYITLRAGKGEVYAQAFTREATTPRATGDIFLAPEDKADWDKPCIADISAPDAAIMASIAEHLPMATLAQALPVYIRPSDAVVGAGYAWLAAN